MSCYVLVLDKGVDNSPVGRTSWMEQFEWYCCNCFVCKCFQKAT